MDNKKIQTIIIAVVCFTLAACTDALDKAPDGRTSLEEVFTDNFRTAAFLNTAYKHIPSYANNWWFTTRGPVVVSDEAWDCDDFDYPEGVGPLMYNGKASSVSYPLTDYVGNETTGAVGHLYARFYECIRFCNTFLEEIDDAEVTYESDRNRWRAEAHLLRAWYYMELLRWFGTGVPLTLQTTDHETADYSTLKKPSYLDVTEQILADCKFALDTDELPWRITSSSEAYRVTKALAEAIRSRAILYAASPLYNDGQDLWERAYQINMEALQNLRDHGYELYNTIVQTGIFRNDVEHPGNIAHLPNHYAALVNEYFTGNQQFAPLSTSSDKETIYTSKAFPAGGNWFIEGVGIQGDYKCGGVPTQEMVDAYDTTDGKPVLNLAAPYADEKHTQPNYNPGTMYNPANPYANRDPRFYASIYYNGSKRTAYWAIGETPECLDNYAAGRDVAGYRTRIISTWAGEPQTGIHNSNRRQTRTGYYLRKFLAPNTGNGDESINTPREKLFRLGEIILNCAEAAAEAGKLDDAIILVDEIRARVGMPSLPPGLTQEELILRIRNERRVELAFEGHRYFDVRRWQQPDGDLSATDKWVTAMEITRNTSGGVFSGYSYTRRPVRPTERACYTNRYLKAPLDRTEAARLSTLTGENWQNPGW